MSDLTDKRSGSRVKLKQDLARCGIDDGIAARAAADDGDRAVLGGVGLRVSHSGIELKKFYKELLAEIHQFRRLETDDLRQQSKPVCRSIRPSVHLHYYHRHLHPKSRQRQDLHCNTQHYKLINLIL